MSETRTGGEKPTLYWVRRDLRLADNPALLQASLRGPVIPVYLHAPDEESPWQPGAASGWWLHQGLAELSASLQQAGSRLVIRKGPSARALQTLARETGAGAVFFNRLYEPALRARDRSVTDSLQTLGLEVESFQPGNLAEPQSLANRQGLPFKVFTHYWKALQSRGEPARALARPDRIHAPAEWPASLTLAELELLPHPGPAGQWTAGLAETWRVGEGAAAARLEAFSEHALKDYPTQRDYPGVDGVSRLSAHLHFGEISPRQVWQRLRLGESHHGNEAQTLAFLRQLGWREFAQHVLYHYPDSPSEPMYPKYRAFPWRKDHTRLLDAWQQGRTGIPVVDAGMRELWHTGFMHNRVRMLAASMLVKNLRIPWWKGAAWFWDTLVDADLANNTMGWQWSAGCGVDAAPYFRIFNPVLQGQKFDARGRYLRQWLPELAALPDKYLHQPWLATAEARCGYPLPIVDLAQSRREALEALAATRHQAG
jgi:deoxyribodipyrimidine photo-lyase